MNINNNNIRIWPIEIDENYIWFSDVLTGGLYRCYKNFEKVKCEIYPTDLSRYGVFRIGAIVSWKKYIILCPQEINNFVLVFSKETKKLKKVFIIYEEKNIYLDGARTIENCLYLNFYRSNMAVIIIGLDELCNYNTKEIIPQIIPYPNNAVYTTWCAKCCDKVIYLPIYNEKIIFKIKQNKICPIIAEIPQNIFTLYIYNSEIWILAVGGWEAYRVDLNGKLQEIASIKQEELLFEENGANNIIVTEKYVFFLLRKKALGCYDRKRKYQVNLKISPRRLENLYPDKLLTIFSEAIEKNGILYLLPYANRGIKINLCTLKCKCIDILFPEEIDTNKNKYYDELILAHKINYLFSEVNSKSLYVYLEYNLFNYLFKNSVSVIGEQIYLALSKA